MAAKRRRVLWSLRAITNARKIQQYLAAAFSETEVENYYRMLNEFEDLVSVFPRLYPSTTQGKLRRAVLSPELSVIYKVGKAEIFAVDVLDNRSIQSH